MKESFIKRQITPGFYTNVLGYIGCALSLKTLTKRMHVKQVEATYANDATKQLK